MNFASSSNRSLALVVSSITSLTPRISCIQLRSATEATLPLLHPGARLQLALGTESRPVPICSNLLQRDYVEIALFNSDFASGSESGEARFRPGQAVKCELADPGFHLHADAAPAIFIAGGIGAAALKPLAETLALRGRRLAFHYAGSSLSDMAFAAALQESLGANLKLYASDQQQRFNAQEVMARAPHQAQLYLCAPQSMMDAVSAEAMRMGFARGQLQSLSFSALPKYRNKPVILELARSGKLLQVAAEQPLLHALRMAGVQVPSKCCVGECGTCIQQVLAGEIDHRDEVLTAEQRAQAKICVCVSRAKTEHLVLDL